MTSTDQLIRDYLMFEPTLVSLMSGGMYTWDETGRLGIGYTNTPLAFDGSDLRPCLAVKMRQLLPTKDIRDEEEQVMSYMRNGQVFLYQEGGTDILDEATQLVYNMLQDRQPYIGVRSQISNITEGRQEESLNGASYRIVEFSLFGLFEPTNV